MPCRVLTSGTGFQNPVLSNQTGIVRYIEVIMTQKKFHGIDSVSLGALLGVVMSLSPMAALAQDTTVPITPVAPQPQTPVVTETAEQKAQKRDMDLLMSVLVETKLSMDQRREAALSLLRKGWDQAVSALVDEFHKPSDPSNQQVIAQAVAGFAGTPPHAFVSPLLSALQEDNENLIDNVAAALGRYQDEPQVTSQLVALAVDKALNVRIRRGAIVSLGYHRNRDVVGVLISLLSAQQPAQVRAASSASLARLTGIHRFGQNLAQWSVWWESHRDLDEKRWLSSLIGNFANHAAALTTENQRVTQRLVESQRQLYLGTPTEERTAMLEKMMAAPELSMRLMALELIVQRLVDQQPIGATLRAALIVALGDSSAQVRSRCAQLIRDLNDPSGADAIAQRLDTETDPTVLRAYLLAMADMPREESLTRAMQLLGDVELQNPAAGVLERAIADGLVTEQHKQALTKQLRQLTAGDDTLSPKMIELLGRVATEDDWLRIAGWMDSPKDTVRIAAAQAWAASDRPLGELAKRAESEMFMPILLRAAVRRGKEGATLVQIARFKPKSEQLEESWQQAMLAMATRVQASDLVEADRAMAQHENVAPIRERLLSAAIGESNVNADVQLLLARASVRLENSQAIQAMADLGLVESRSQNLTAEVLQRLHWLTVRAAMESSQPEKAWQTVDAWFVSLETTQAKQDLAQRLLTYVTGRIIKAIDARQIDQATTQLAQLRKHVQEHLLATSMSKLDELSSRITKTTQQIAKDQAAASAATSTDTQTVNTSGVPLTSP